MPISPLPQAPYRQDNRTFPTPLIGDVVFSEIRDCTRITFPEYGTPHPNPAKWPYHKLVFIKSVDIERDGIFEFFYAADRDHQDLYNFQFQQADIGGTKFDSVVRTYVSPRANFTPTNYAMGQTMTSDPDGVFSDTYVLAEYKQVDSQDQILNSLYVTEQLTYVKKVSIVEAQYDERVGRGNQSKTIVFYRGEYTAEYPKNTAGAITIEDIFSNPAHPYWGLQSELTNIFRKGSQLSDNWFAVQESYIVPPSSTNSVSNPAKRFVITRPTPLSSDVIFVESGALPTVVPAYGTPHYDTDKWPDHKLSLINPASGDSSGRLYDFYYVANRLTQDLYNYQFQQADIGGTKFDSVVRTYVSPRADFRPTNYAMGQTMTSDPDGVFSGTYVLAEYKQVDSQDQILNSLYVTEQLTYVKKEVLVQEDFDEYFGKNVKTTQFLAYATETVEGASSTAAQLFKDSTSSYWGLQNTGLVRSGRQLTAKWYAITEAEAIPSSIVDNGRTYYTTVNYGWPAELAPNISSFLQTWTKKDGGQQTYFQPEFLKNQYSGPCRAKIVETFLPKPSTESSALSMEPLPINISNPYFSISVGPTLHGAATVSFTNGTGDTEFEFTAANYTIPATSPSTRPSEIVVSDEVKPFRGGYLRQVTTVYEPESV
jgi:hypothetical protein